MKAIIIDDEPLARSIVTEYLANFPQIEVAAECNDGFEGVKATQQHKPELIFLDIQMPKINGFEMLELLEEPPAIIFTTAFDEYAMKAFEAHAVDYLLKPFSQERFDKAVQKLLSQTAVKQQKTAMEEMLDSTPVMPSQQDRIVVKTGGKIKIINVQSVQFLEAADDYVKIHTTEGVFLKNRTMGYYEKSLPANNFLRTHRSYMVNVQEITRIDPYEKESHLAILRSGGKVPVSKSGYAKLNLRLV
ncbi:MAG: response regulator [Chitinophagaceae bacterium]|nr:MAG: response regulator [Chitinophagaceae bacterium]